MKILYLEDEIREGENFMPKLVRMGFEPLWEKTLEGALAQIPNAQNFRFGLFDIKLLKEEGDTSGILAANRFVKECNMPVFLISNHTGDPTIIDKAKQAGIPANFIFPKKITEDNEGLFRQYLLTAVESNAYERFLPQSTVEELPGGKVAISAGQGGTRWFIAKEDILFLEANGDYCNIYIRPKAQGGTHIIQFSRTLKQAFEQFERLFPSTMFKFGRGIAINLAQMERITDGHVYFTGSNDHCHIGTAVEAYYGERGWSLTTTRTRT